MRELIGGLRVMILIGLTLVTVACTQTTPTPPPANSTRPVVSATVVPAATPTPTPTSLAASAANVGPVPQNCPPGPTPKNVDPLEFGPGVGGSPVWAIGFAGPHATIHLNGLSEDPSLVQYGWNYKILWSVGLNYTHPVVLRGGLLSDGTPLWFRIGDQPPVTAPVLDPRYPGTLTGSDAGWAEFPSYLLIPKAGCYYLEASWPGGSWRITFAAGL
jgi:hypothetical protein